MDEVEAFLFTFIQQCCSSEWEILQAQIKVMAGAENFQAIRPYGLRYGAQAPDTLPPHDASLLSLYTPFHSRRLHGRIYLPAVPEGEQVSGLVSDAHLQRVSNVGSIMVSRWGELGNSPNAWLCVFSRANGVQRVLLPFPHLTYDPLAAIPITRTVAHRDVATQRHRKRGRGI